MQVDVEHALKSGLAVIDDHVVAVGVQTGSSRCPRDPLPDGHHGGEGFRRRIGQVDGVLLRDDQGMALVNGRMSSIAR